MYIETIPLWEDRKDVTLTTFLSQDDPFIAEKFPKKRPAVIVCPEADTADVPVMTMREIQWL